SPSTRLSARMCHGLLVPVSRGTHGGARHAERARQQHAEGAAAARPVFHPEGAAMRGDDLAADREPESDAAPVYRATGARLVEPLEDSLLVLVRDAGAAIRDGGEHHAGFRVRPPERAPPFVGYEVRTGGGVPRRHDYGHTLRRELYRVLRAVDQDPSDPFRTAAE